MMTIKKFKLICDNIGSISPFIRFVGVIGERGEVTCTFQKARINTTIR